MPLTPDDGIDDEFQDTVPASPESVPEAPEEPEEDASDYLAYDRVTPERALPVLLDEDGEALPGFDEKYRDDFEGLAYIGALMKRFTWLGHRFAIKTLAVDEMLAVGMLTKEYGGSIGQGLAYRTAMVALAVTSVDGKDLPIPVGPEQDPLEWAHQRFDYAKARWFQFTIDAVYNEYLELEEKTQKVVTALGKASGSTGLTTG